jgi:iron complex transport system permease protein
VSLWLSLSVLLALVLISIAVGKYRIGPGELVTALINRLQGGDGEVPTVIETVIFQIRLPRITAAVLVGAALAAAGATYQSLFRNPLASPDILGVSAGAGLGAAAGIFLSLPVAGIQLLAFAFGSFTVLLVYVISRAVRGHDPVLVLVLAGVVMGTLAGSCISLLKYLADPYDQLPAITFWLLGSLNAVNPADMQVSLLLVGLGLVPLYLLRWRMNLMSLGDEEARALGVNAGRLRLVFIMSATLVTASAVSISGVIGWVGLMIPHIARLLVGPDFARLLPTSMLLGAAYLLGVDDLARTIGEVEIPLGILTAFLGAPFFLWLLAHSRRGWQ